MKVPTEAKFNFNPTEKGVVSFGNEIAKIIYCCIRPEHIVDGNFDRQVLDFAKKLAENMPEYYLDFQRLVRRSKLSCFGRRTVMEFGFKYDSILDDDFWIGVWEYINKWKTLKITIREEVTEK